MSPLRWLPLASLLASACLLDTGGGGDPSIPACAAPTSAEIDNGASLTYAVGVDAGYYLSYLGGGHWHVEWTCDTRVSAYGCNFTGTITAPAPAQGPNATCVQCESNDILNVGADGATGMKIDFDTITTTGLDGVDFYSTPGAAVTFDLLVDGSERPDLVFVPSGGRSVSPTCAPLILTPDTP
jgi:hypothetical protein